MPPSSAGDFSLLYEATTLKKQNETDLGSFYEAKCFCALIHLLEVQREEVGLVYPQK